MSYEGGKNEEIYIGNMSRAYVYNALVWQNMVVCFQKSRRYARQTRKRKCHIHVLLLESLTYSSKIVSFPILYTGPLCSDSPTNLDDLQFGPSTEGYLVNHRSSYPPPSRKFLITRLTVFCQTRAD